ncbi:TPA: ThiF family adenylyltransferase [Vibrio parahaemolyticus]|nr:ThiF family adenylyltransferase [Vibrio parahaemolyticus]
MTMGLNSIEEELLSRGFRYSPIHTSYPPIPAFERVFATSIGEFVVQFPISDPSLLKLPKPRVLSMPESLASVRLPHLEGNQTICLFDETTKNIDPLRPKEFVAACVVQIQSILDGWADGSNHSDIAAEFTSYWAPDRICYLLSENKKSQLYKFSREKLNGDCVTEYAVANNSSDASQWAVKRNCSSVKDGKLPSELCSTIKVAVKQPLFIPFDQQWPLNTLGDVLTWLRKVDSSAASSLLDKLRKEAKTKSNFMVVLSFDTIHVGLNISIRPLGKSALFVNLPKNAKFNPRHALSALSKHHCLSVFERFHVENATEKYIFSRNYNSFEGLRNKRICVIGCGTVGGYLAQGLVQAGAGTGRGTLCFYDRDTMRPGNLGRHILGTQYLGENKSEALAHYFEQQGLSTNVRPGGEFTKRDLGDGWDLIVDATGEQGFSLLLTQWYQELKLNERSTLLIHSWVSGFGHQAKAMINDGKGACYACLFDYNQSPRADRYQSFSPGNSLDVNIAFKRTCGESHLPFGPEASMTAAALALRLIKQDQPMKLNFLQKALSDRAKQYPEKLMEPMRNCPVCQS